MTDRIDDQGDTHLPPEEEAGLQALEEHLRQARPVPRAAFRSELRGRLLERQHPWAMRRIQRLVVAYATSGVALLAVAVLGVAGAGPLSAG